MTQARKPSPPASQSELEALYRAGAEAEPDNGLDRMVRARADQALDRAGKRRPARWIAGLATAGALVLAVGIALQQPTPPPSTPTPSALDSADPAPASARPALERAAEMDRLQAPESAILMDQASPVDFAAGRDPDADASIEEIRGLLQSGRLDRAESLLRDLMERKPMIELPDDLAALKSRIAEPGAEPDCGPDRPVNECR